MDILLVHLILRAGISSNSSDYSPTADSIGVQKLNVITTKLYTELAVVGLQ